MQPEPDSKQVRSAAIGVAIVIGAAVLGVLAFVLPMRSRQVHRLHIAAEFKDVRNLKPGANVYVAGIRAGAVDSVELDPKKLESPATVRVTLDLTEIPDDSTVSITSEGLLGPTSLGITLGRSHTAIHEGAYLHTEER